MMLFCPLFLIKWLWIIALLMSQVIDVKKIHQCTFYLKKMCTRNSSSLPPSLPIIKYLSKSKPKNAWHSYILRCYVIWCVLCIYLVVHTLQQYRGSLNSPKSKRQFQYWVVSFWSQNNQYYIVKLVRLLAKVWFSALTRFKQHTNSAIQSQYTWFG